MWEMKVARKSQRHQSSTASQEQLGLEAGFERTYISLVKRASLHIAQRAQKPLFRFGQFDPLGWSFQPVVFPQPAGVGLVRL